MPEMLKPVDVVVMGTGAAGGTAVWPLANAGMKVVAIEAGPRATVKRLPVRRGQERHPRLVGPVQGKPGGTHDRDRTRASPRLGRSAWSGR